VRQLTEIEVFFSEDVATVDAGDLLINGVAADTVSFGAPGQVSFGFVEPAPGPITVTFIPGHGITDVSPAMNPFAGDSWTYTLDPNAEEAGIIINEFMASNDEGIRDEDGDTSDWIELKNASGVSGNLEGWFLTDDPNYLNNPSKLWEFPARIVLPNDYLLIFASGKNRAPALGELHTSFQLAASGGYLALLDPETNVVDVFESYPPQVTDFTYGSDRANPLLKGFFSEPTPGVENASSGPDFAPVAAFSHDSRTFVDPFTLTLVAPPGATIYYTTTTNLPTEASPVYTAPITIDSTAMIRTRVYQPGKLPSAPRTEHFIQLNPNATTFTSDLPITILHNYGRGPVPASGEQYVAMMVFETKSNGRSSITNKPDLVTAGRFRLRGSSTQGYAKGSFAYEAWNEFFDDRDIELLGMPPESDFAFYAPNNFDVSLISNPLAYQLHRDMGRYAPRTRFSEVILKDNSGTPGSIDLPNFTSAGDYNGIYVFTEKIKPDKNRVDIDRLRDQNTSGLALTGGYLLKVDRADPGDSGFGAAGQTIRYVDPDETTIERPERDPQQQYIIGWFNQFGAALNGANYRDPVTGFRRYVDLEPAFFHSIHNVVTHNIDALRLSAFFYRPRDRTNDLGQLIEGKLTFGPSWDFDRTEGSTDGRDFNPEVFRSRIPDLGTDYFNYPWWGRMFTDPDFWQGWIDAYQEYRQGPLSTNNIIARIDQFANELREAEPRERTRWNQLPRTGLQSRDGYSFDFGPREYDGELRYKREWFSDRVNYIDSQLLARPVLSLAGGDFPDGLTLIIAGPPDSTIYYTLDGTDPRATGGTAGNVQPASGAIQYTGPITINANARVVARAWDPNHNNVTGANNPPITSHWSGPAKATYVIQTPPLLITEIMYNPRPAAVEVPLPPEAQQFEYLEIKNVGSAVVNLAGAHFTRGIEYTFSSGTLNPGENIVLAKNPAAFASRYGAGANVVGPYVGFLDNGGERLTLIGGLEEELLDFTYNDSWYRVTDGSGFSLVVVDETAPRRTDLSLRSSWRVSSQVNGSPGANNPAALGLPGVLVNEVLTHTDLPSKDTIELYNPTGSPADISGWFLTDDFGDPLKYVIPANTIIDVGGYMLFDEDDFNVGGAGFGLSSKGDEVYLFSGDGSDLTGYAIGFDFGPALNGVTFGRHIISTGGDQFPRQSSSTLGFENAGPGVGPIVITEIMYHPPDLPGGFDNADDEFIELHNMSEGTVRLDDPAFPANTWRLRDAVDYDFPMGTTMAAKSYLLVVNFDPTTNATELAAWRTRNNVSGSVPILGPWQGKLDNSAESVELRQPDGPEPGSGVVSYPLVERVKYEDGTPWQPAADGFGPSLQRNPAGAYGNDPGSWVAAGKTPGGPYTGGATPRITMQPEDTVVVAYLNTSLSVAVDVAAGPYTFQWLFKGDPIAGATSSTLTLENVQPEQAGSYQVLVINAASAISSAAAELTVLIPANIVGQPVAQSVEPGANVSLSVVATSSSPISYQWRKNGIPINGATSSVLSLANVQPSDDAIYSVVLTDAVGPITSDAVRVTVLVNPTILTPAPRTAVTQTIPEGSSVTLSVTVTNTATLPIGYRWRRGGATVGLRIVNSRTDFLTINNFALADAGGYTCVTTNEAFYAPGELSGRITLSLGASVDQDGDGIPDDYEDANGLDKTLNDAGLDPDMDGFTNGEEFTAGTDPQDGGSFLKVEPVSGGVATIGWIAQPGKTYAVQYRDSATTGVWQYLAGVPASDDPAHLVEVVDDAALAEGERYYRLVTPGTTEPSP